MNSGLRAPVGPAYGPWQIAVSAYGKSLRPTRVQAAWDRLEHSSAGRPGTKRPVARRRRALCKRGRNDRATKKVIPDYRSRVPTQPVIRWHTPTDIRVGWAWAGSGFHVGGSIHSNQPGEKALPGLFHRNGQEGGPPFNTSMQRKATHGCEHCTVLAVGRWVRGGRTVMYKRCPACQPPYIKAPHGRYKHDTRLCETQTEALSRAVPMVHITVYPGDMIDMQAWLCKTPSMRRQTCVLFVLLSRKRNKLSKTIPPLIKLNVPLTYTTKAVSDFD